MATEKSPKARRPSGGAPSTKEITQANATAEIFFGAGSRQNRWMQGYVPSTSAESEDATTSSTATPFFRSALNAANSGSTSNAHNAVEMQQDIPNSRDTAQITPLTTSGVSMHMLANRTAIPGLPSPVASDGTTNSPTPRPRSSLGGPNMWTPNPALISQVNNLNLAQAAAVPGGPPAHSNHARRPSQHLFSNGANALQLASQHAMPASLPHLGPTAVSPQQHSFAASQLQSFTTDPLLSPKAMWKRLKTQPKTDPRSYAHRWLGLLTEAVKRGDLFFVVLTQLHALTKFPDSIPQSARDLRPQCFASLGMLLFHIDTFPQNVLAWLRDFPAPVKDVYFMTHSTAKIYESQLQQVVQFLHLLPVCWDNLIMQSETVGSPPLVEDMVDVLHLHSPVLQSVVFKLIAKRLLDRENLSHLPEGLAALEAGHALDQARFIQNGRRNPQQNILAHRAFPIVIEKLREEGTKKTGQQGQPTQQRRFHFDPVLPPEIVTALCPISVPIASRGSVAIPSPAVAQPQPPSLGHTRTSSHALYPPVLHPRHTPLDANQLTSLQYEQMIQNQIQMARQQQGLTNTTGLVFPREHEKEKLPRPLPLNPDPTRHALHQAHLRSPKLGPVEVQEGAPRLYRHVVGFGFTPTKLDPAASVQNISFNISPADFERIPLSTQSQLPGEPPNRILTEKSQTYRLRCAACPREGFRTESSWIEATNIWPQVLFLECNGVMLEMRQKLHYKRDLPIDLTKYVKAGENVIKVILNRYVDDTKPFEYCLAVEIVGVSSHETIKRHVRTISAEQTRESIKTGLQGTDGDDDDIVVTSSKLTIRLFDPMSKSGIPDTPVRGASCLHRDCFDLETFLGALHRDQPGWPSGIDVWRCPFCRGDVRPQTLVLDEFLVEVRKDLEGKGLMNAREIIVEQDGSWTVKEEERTGVRSPSLERDERLPSVIINEKQKIMLEVIEID